jgi:hypothetical protein
MSDSEKGPPSEWKTARFWLAIGVTVVSIIAVAILASRVIDNGKDISGNAQNVLNSVLPLLGTWVGTILAYYFSKENFEAATKSVTELAKQITPQEKLKATLAREKMIPQVDMFSKSLPAENIKLADTLTELEQTKKGSRIPILGDKKEVQYVLHRSLIDKFLANSARSGKTNTEIAALTVADLLKDPTLKKFAEAVAVIKEDATLADAMSLMNQIENCQDVFVTATGTKNEAIKGWITNVIIQDNAKV